VCLKIWYPEYRNWWSFYCLANVASLEYPAFSDKPRLKIIFVEAIYCWPCATSARPQNMVPTKSQMRNQQRWRTYLYLYLYPKPYIYIYISISISSWWFQTFFIFGYIGNNHPNWLIFFRGVETTNYIYIYIYISISISLYLYLYIYIHSTYPLVIWHRYGKAALSISESEAHGFPWRPSKIGGFVSFFARDNNLQPWNDGFSRKCGPDQQQCLRLNFSMDWFKGKSTGNHRFSH
jgi:hypothetical protein